MMAQIPRNFGEGADVRSILSARPLDPGAEARSDLE
jgi:hypothetical protein